MSQTTACLLKARRRLGSVLDGPSRSTNDGERVLCVMLLTHARVMRVWDFNNRLTRFVCSTAGL